MEVVEVVVTPHLDQMVVIQFFQLLQLLVVAEGLQVLMVRQVKVVDPEVLVED